MGRIRARPSRCFPLLTAAALCCFWGAEGKVYYSCGAQFNSLERGLILSPGFPNNYSSGTHCVWRFLIPAKTYLMLEIFDFDVFESISENPNAWDGYFFLTNNPSKNPLHTEETTDVSSTIFPARTSPQDPNSKDFDNFDNGLSEATSQNFESKEFHPRKEPKEVAVTQPSQLPIQAGINVTLPGGGGEERKDLVNTIFFAHATVEQSAESPEEHLGKRALGEDADISTIALPINLSTPSFPAADVCPDDVLYVSDLTAFSSRFCGAKSPLNKNMTFGSSLKMVEVIVELITTTDRGRGFAMLFEYRNRTDTVAVHNFSDGGENVMMLVVITGILFFALILLSLLCIACRQKLCPKRTFLDGHSDQENRIQNATVDISELQLVFPGQENENNNHSIGGNGAVTPCRHSQEPSTVLEASSMTVATGSNEVFIISTSLEAGGLNWTPCRLQDQKLQRSSIKSPCSVSEWLSAGQMELAARGTDPRPSWSKGSSPKPQTWRAPTFHDLLTPFPQLQQRWAHRATSSPFTKLANKGGFPTPTPDQTITNQKVTSDGEIEGTYLGILESSASYPLTHSAQKQRKLSGGCNLKRSRFGNPSFGFVTSSPKVSWDAVLASLPEHSKEVGTMSPIQSPLQGGTNALDGPARLKSNVINGSKPKVVLLEVDQPKAGFVISEEADDQQPLVLAEHTNQYVDVSSGSNALVHDAGMAMVEEEMVDLPL